MHELSIAQSLVDAVLSAAADYDAARVTVVRLRVGELRQLIEATLRDAFELCAAGTRAEGAKLEIEWVCNTWRCSACGRLRDLDDDGGCPCGAADAVDRMEGCDDLLLTSVDLEEG